MKIVIFSGTTEGKRLSYALADQGIDVVVSVATDYGSEAQGEHPGVTTLSGRMPVEDMTRLLKTADLCVDATHPYATRVTGSIRTACAAAGTEYCRLLRTASDTAGAVVVPDADAAAEYLAGTAGNILLTTGAKELPAFAAIAPERLYPRLLPTHQGLSACEALGIPHRNIIAMQGPFSREMNAATIRQYGIAYLVTKDGGAPGGFPEKAEAARETGAALIVLRRPEETGEGFVQVLEYCIKKRSALER